MRGALPLLQQYIFKW